METSPDTGPSDPPIDPPTDLGFAGNVAEGDTPTMSDDQEQNDGDPEVDGTNEMSE